MSSELVAIPGRLPTGVAFMVRRLVGRPTGVWWSEDTRRVPNFALAEDSRPYDARAVPRLGVVPGLPLVTGFWTVILSAPQYEKLILLFLSESSESLSSSSSSGRGMIRGWFADWDRERTTLAIKFSQL